MVVHPFSAWYERDAHSHAFNLVASNVTWLTQHAVGSVMVTMIYFSQCHMGLPFVTVTFPISYSSRHIHPPGVASSREYILLSLPVIDPVPLSKVTLTFCPNTIEMLQLNAALIMGDGRFLDI